MRFSCFFLVACTKTNCTRKEEDEESRTQTGVLGNVLRDHRSAFVSISVMRVICNRVNDMSQRHRDFVAAGNFRRVRFNSRHYPRFGDRLEKMLSLTGALCFPDTFTLPNHVYISCTSSKHLHSNLVYSTPFSNKPILSHIPNITILIIINVSR